MCFGPITMLLFYFQIEETISFFQASDFLNLFDFNSILDFKFSLILNSNRLKSIKQKTFVFGA